MGPDKLLLCTLLHLCSLCSAVVEKKTSEQDTKRKFYLYIYKLNAQILWIFEHVELFLNRNSRIPKHKSVVVKVIHLLLETSVARNIAKNRDGIFHFPYPKSFLKVLQCRTVLVILHCGGGHNHRHSLFRFFSGGVTQVVKNCAYDGIAYIHILILTDINWEAWNQSVGTNLL